MSFFVIPLSIPLIYYSIIHLFILYTHIFWASALLSIIGFVESVPFLLMICYICAFFVVRSSCIRNGFDIPLFFNAIILRFLFSLNFQRPSISPQDCNLCLLLDLSLHVFHFTSFFYMTTSFVDFSVIHFYNHPWLYSFTY